MKFDLKHRLAILPLLAYSAAAMTAEPIALSTQDMDRITAGAQSVLERIENVIKAAHGMRTDLGMAGDQLAWLTQLTSSGPITFHWTESGELIMNKQAQSGDTVTTYLLQPGERLTIQQAVANGANYLYIHSTGNSSVAVSQQHL